jgi:glycosyltransferase involved in cell wall biosynthesis
MRHDHEILPGVQFRLGETTFHLNVSILKSLAQYQPDVVVAAGAWHMPATLLVSQRLTGRAFVSVFWSEGHADAARHTGGPVAWLRRRALRSHDAFAVPNRRSADWLRSQVGETFPIVELPNTVQGDFFARRHQHERTRARQQLGIPAFSQVFLQVSQLTSRKGVLPLTKAFLALSEDLTHTVRLALVGTGPERAELQDLAQQSRGQIIMAGGLGMEGIRQWLMAADWFVLNSFLDPNPLAPIEGCFASLPLLLSSRAGNYDELLKEGRTGYGIADPELPDEALRRALATSPEKSAIMGEQARVNCAMNFDLHQVATKLKNDLVALKLGQCKNVCGSADK